MRWLWLLLLVACFDPTGIYMQPPERYRELYHKVEACSGLQGNFDLIQWQHVYDLREGNRMYAGYWYPKHKITIRDDYLNNDLLIMHEEMHDLLQDGAHPDYYFNGVCGNLIVP